MEELAVTLAKFLRTPYNKHWSGSMLVRLRRLRWFQTPRFGQPATSCRYSVNGWKLLSPHSQSKPLNIGKKELWPSGWRRWFA